MLYHSVVQYEEPSIDSVKRALLPLSSTRQELLRMVCMQAISVTVDNATSEKSFSALHHVKSYLRTTMTQSGLNHLMISHYHQDLCDKLDLKFVRNE